MTEFYISVAKVEGSGELSTEGMLRAIIKSILHIHYRFKIKSINDTTIKITYRDK